MSDKPLCEELPPVPAPCIYCREPVTADDRRDVVMAIGTGELRAVAHWAHWECLARAVIGGVNHLRGECGCFKAPAEACEPDPPGMSKREAARAALALFRDQQRNGSN